MSAFPEAPPNLKTMQPYLKIAIEHDSRDIVGEFLLIDEWFEFLGKVMRIFGILRVFYWNDWGFTGGFLFLKILVVKSLELSDFFNNKQILLSIE